VDLPYQYPPDLMALLIDTIPLLCRSKADVLQFLRGAGVPGAVLDEPSRQLSLDRNSISKYDIARRVLTALNEAGDSALGPRREILKRVVEFEDFSTCWSSDQLKAKGLVGEIRRVVNVKDSFTRLAHEHEIERQTRLAQQERAAGERLRRRKALQRLHNELAALFVSTDNPQARGRALEKLMNDLFRASGLLVREAFALVGAEGGVEEQIDGVIEVDGHLYVVEVKWLAGPADVIDISRHLTRVAARGHAAALIISASGFTSAAVSTCRDALNRNMTVVLCDLHEIVLLLEREAELAAFLRSKIHEAIAGRNPLYLPLVTAS
jgi:restriction system protein